MDQSEKFKPGFIGYHKAAFLRCVTKHPSVNGMVVVTTSEGQDIVVAPEQLWTEQEWKDQSK